MTVAELIKALSGMPQDWQVVLHNEYAPNWKQLTKLQDITFYEGEDAPVAEFGNCVELS